MKHFRTLQPDELARMAETRQEARDYIIENAFELLTGAAEQAEARTTEIYDEAHQDGLETGGRARNEALRGQYWIRIERAMTDLLGKKTDPDQLGKKKAKLWDLLCDISRELEA